MSSLNNLTLTAINGAYSSVAGGAWHYLQSRLGNSNRDTNCKFYYDNNRGGSIIQVAARSVTQGLVNGITDMANNAFKSLLDGKKKNEQQSNAWIVSELTKQAIERAQYGFMRVLDETGQVRVVYALDDWGCVGSDALMLGIGLKDPITVSQSYPVNNVQTISPSKSVMTRSMSFISKDEDYYRDMGQVTKTNGPFQTKTLVWYDTTALITINSDKNLISTRVTGRDYSRKELVSNGDIKFSVSGQITSGRPDIYPTEEMHKFYKVMQYKGVIRVNNQVLNELGITHIVITDFSVTPKEGYKALQNYTFNALGLQPETEIEIKKDTVEIIPQGATPSKDTSEGWLDMLKGQMDGLKSISKDAFSQGVGIAAGLLDDVL